MEGNNSIGCVIRRSKGDPIPIWNQGSIDSMMTTYSALDFAKDGVLI